MKRFPLFVLLALFAGMPFCFARADRVVANLGDGRGTAFTVSDSGYYELRQVRDRQSGASQGEQPAITVRVDGERIVFKAEGKLDDFLAVPLGFITKGSMVHVEMEKDKASPDERFDIVKKGAVIVAGFQHDFQTGCFSRGWHYLWNKPVGCSTNNSGELGGAEIGVSAHYNDLVWDEQSKTYSAGGADHCSHTQSGLLWLGKTSGSPGLADDEESPNSKKRYVIASYKVGSTGFYAIADSWLKENNATDGSALEVLIHIDDHSPILRRFIQRPGNTIHFDTDLAYLEAGAKIYVCVGRGAHFSGNTFSMDFTIVRLDGGKSIRAQIAEAKGSSVRIFPTRYYADAQQINFESVHDFEINGYGVCYILTHHHEKFISLNACSRVKILGLTMDYDPLHFTQGKILDIQDKRITLRPLRGYPAPMPGEGHYSTKTLSHDPATMRWKLGASVSQIQSVSKAGDNYVLEMRSKPRELNWAAGDYMSFYKKGAGSVVHLVLCRNILLKDLTLHQYGGWGITSSKGVGNTFDGLRLTRGPKPFLATIDRLRAGDYDGFNLFSEESPIIKNCLIEANCDDAIHVGGGLSFVLKDVHDSSIVQVASRGNDLQNDMEIYFQPAAGKEVRRIIRRDDSVVSPKDVEAILTALYPRLRLKGGFLRNIHQLTLDKKVSLAAGDMAYVPAKCGKGLRIQNNVIQNNPGRSIVVKCVEGVIEGNDIRYTGGPGVKVEVQAESYGTGGFAENLLIRDNKFTAVAARNAGNASVLWIDCVGKELARNDAIRIEKNHFAGCFGVNVSIADAKNVILKGNKFYNPGHHISATGTNLASNPQNTILWADNVSNVVLDDTERNYYYNKPLGMNEVVGGSVSGLLYPGEAEKQ